MAKREIVFNQKKFEISYEVVNVEKKEVLVFLHGWGSRKELMKQSFGKFFKEYSHLYIDLPGFGKSFTQEVLTTEDYSHILALFFKELNITPFAIFGHSFGGKVATLLDPKNLVLLSSAGILEKKPLNVRIKIPLFKLLKPFGSEKLRKFFASKDGADLCKNMYETMKNVVNEDFTEIFRNYRGNGQIFWGESDKATSLHSGKKIHSLIKNSAFFSLDGDHFFFLGKGREIERKISFIE